jgi:hypothetical protein
MAGNSPGDIQDQVTKTQSAALGIRAKSGWAAVVLLTRLADAPQIVDIKHPCNWGSMARRAKACCARRVIYARIAAANAAIEAVALQRWLRV